MKAVYKLLLCTLMTALLTVSAWAEDILLIAPAPTTDPWGITLTALPPPRRATA